MKRVIDGKRYDTDTAVEIASWSNGVNSFDFNHCSEELFRTKKGNYFLHGDGGALSCWSTSLEGGRSRGGGEGIRALTPAEALTWLEDHDEDVSEDCPELAALIEEA